ncbi:MAG: bifunctional 2-polyprenyl-6-hydroxyphenol methylase/3-demethylubiquinol 3-O-methyltransferase UbiG [Burkholderiales bacterium]
MTNAAALPPSSATATANADPAEIAKFEALAARWWDPESEFRPLHQINPLRANWIETLCGGLANKVALDVGCGGGILAEAMAQRGAQVTGIDLADKALRVAELHGLESGAQVRYVRSSAEDFATKAAGSFDVVTCMEMLEHVPDPAQVVAACTSLVRPGGWVFFSTLNRNPKSFLFAIIGAEYILRLLPRGTHEYAKFIRPSELAHWARSAGLGQRALSGLTYNPITRAYRLHPQDLSVNYLLAYQRPSA